MPVVLLVGAGIAVAALLSLLERPVYVSTSRVFVSATGAASVQDLSQGNAFTQQIVQSYASVATNPIVLTPVIDALGLNRSPASVANSMTVRALVDTSVLEIDVRDASPARAARIANEVTAQLSDVTAVLSPTSDGESAVTLTQIAPAVPAVRPVTPNVPLNLMIGLVVGAVLGVGGAVLRFFVNDRIRNVDDITRVTDRPVLGHTLYNRALADHPLGAWAGESNADAERYRAIRTNLQFMRTESTPQVLLVTSALPGEGKSSVASNLSIAFAQAGSKVALVDADMRKPTVATKFGIEGDYGLSDALSSPADVRSMLQAVGGIEGLVVLPSGRIPPNPSELLGARWPAVVRTLGSVADVVVVDSPPLLPVTDAAVLAPQADTVVFVVAANSSKEGAVNHALETLDRAVTTQVAIVLSGLRDSSASVYYGTYETP